MSKKIDIIIALGISTVMLILWAYKMLITSDIPAEMSFRDAILISSLLLLFFMIYVFYIRHTKFIIINIILLALPLTLWFMCMQQAVTYHYHKYDTIVSIIGFISVFFPFCNLFIQNI